MILAYKTLSAIKQNKFKFLHEDLQILFLLEVTLVFGDLFVLIDEPCVPDKKKFNIYAFFIARSIFITLSFFNGCVAL